MEASMRDARQLVDIEMSAVLDIGPLDEVPRRTDELFIVERDASSRRTHRVFVALFVAQWVFAVVVALVWAPYGWNGRVRSLHTHVATAIALGGLINALPIFMILAWPRATATRHAVAAAQMLWSALFIHLT